MMAMRLLITGASGLLGRRVVELALHRGHEALATVHAHPVSLGQSVPLNLTNVDQIRSVIDAHHPDAIIHVAAYTHVDGCESDKTRAWQINVDATSAIASAADTVAAHLLYVSTDYVFDGAKGSYAEDDHPNPLSYYGYTKLKGEEAVQEQAREWCIARTSVIYGWGSSRRKNFATWLLDTLTAGHDVPVVVDQHVSPTLNTNLAQMLLEIAERRLSGILHTAGATAISRYDFATHLADVFHLNDNLIREATMDTMSWTATRPRNSSLNVQKAQALLQHKPLRLRPALQAMMHERDT